jgi:ABC-type nitrate/sulfonate/bicarbonate transport system substrate-binding protein
MSWRTFSLNPLRLSILLALAVGLMAAGCGGGDESPPAAPATTQAPAATEQAATTEAPATTEAAPEPATVRLALDWTPNTNHTGFFVAQEMGFYEDAGIDFKVIPYSNAATDTLVANDKAECGVNFEDFMTIAVSAGIPEKSVMAILQSSPVAVMVRGDSPIQSPKDLDGKKYGGFGLPGETEIMQAVIRNDGGNGEFQNVTLSTAAYEAVYNNKVDFSYGFQTWEIIEAKLRGIDLKVFPIEDYGFPRYYSVLLACNIDWLEQNPDVAKRFVAATVKGWEWAQQHPDESAKILIDSNPGVFTNEDLVYESNKLLADKYWLDPNGRFGCQNLNTWTEYPTFLYKNKVLKDPDGNDLTSPPEFSSLFTNDYLPETCD